jgi:dUTP pyrophosphatase
MSEKNQQDGGRAEADNEVERRSKAEKVTVRQTEEGEGLELPGYETEKSAGLDLRAAVPEGETEEIEPGERALIDTGIKVALPEGCEGQIRPRSGLAYRHGVTVLNGPGTIDADYRGEVKVLLINLGEEVFEVERGMRIAQLVVAEYKRVEWEKESLDETSRGEGGFGSTGEK